MNESINEWEMVNIGGVKQYILVRGEKRNNPIMLFLHGGPGAPMSPVASFLPEELEKNYLTVHWDQRGAGKSYFDNIPVESMCLEQLISDTIEVVDYLLNKYNRKKMYLFAGSWGTVLGINAVYRNPEKFYAYIGTGQIINVPEGEKISYEFILETVKKQKNDEAIIELEKIGNPPYKNNDDLMIQRKWLRKLGFSERNTDTSRLYIENCSEEEIERIVQGVGFSGVNIMPQLSEYNIDHIKEVKIPVYFCMGRYDYQTPSSLVKKYYESLIAPEKEFIWFENSAHAPIFEEPDKFAKIILKLLDKQNKMNRPDCF